MSSVKGERGFKLFLFIVFAILGSVLIPVGKKQENNTAFALGIVFAVLAPIMLLQAIFKF